MNARRRAVSLTFAVAIVVTACGEANAPISRAERARLAPLVERVRRAAESLDRPATRQSLTNLRRAVAAAEDRGELSSASAAEILAAADQVESRVVLLPARTTTTTTTTTTTAPPDTGRGHGNKKHDRDKGNGNAGKGDGQD